MDRKTPSFRQRLGRKRKLVLLICTGDTCRSPMAAGYLRRLLEEHHIKNVDVRSAGVLTVTGLRASQEARQIMESEEVNLDSHRSCQLSAEMIHKADIILGMTPYHVQRALRISEEARSKTFLLKEHVCNDPKNGQITDPMGSTLEVFKSRFKEIKKALDLLIQKDFFTEEISQSDGEEAQMESAPDGAKKKTKTAKKPKKTTAKPAAQKPKKKKTPAKKTKAKKVKAKKAPAKKAAKTSKRKGSPQKKSPVSKRKKSIKSNAKKKR